MEATALRIAKRVLIKYKKNVAESLDSIFQFAQLGSIHEVWPKAESGSVAIILSLQRHCSYITSTWIGIS